MEYGITEGVRIEDENGNIILIIVENILEGIASIQITKLNSDNKEVPHISFSKKFYCSDIKKLFSIKNNKLAIEHVHSFTIDDFGFSEQQGELVA